MGNLLSKILTTCRYHKNFFSYFLSGRTVFLTVDATDHSIKHKDNRGKNIKDQQNVAINSKVKYLNSNISQCFIENGYKITHEGFI